MNISTMNKDRIGRVTKTMRDMGLGQIVVSSTASVYYLTGIYAPAYERLLALLIFDDGETCLFANAALGVNEALGTAAAPEAALGAAAAPGTAQGTAPEAALFTHEDGEDPTADLSARLRPGAVGIDKFLYSKFLLGLMRSRADITPVDGSAPVDMARAIKDEREREALRKSSRANDRVMAAAVAAVRDGATESEITSLVNREFRRMGARSDGKQVVCFGANGADPHHAADSTVVARGDSVVLDLFTPIVERYWCDMTRTFFFGEANAKRRDVYELVRRANEAAIAAVRPGVALSTLDGIARSVIADGGYGKYFTHRLGHGCGLECHEPPDVSGANGALIEAGMVFSIEPGVYLPGEFGVRVEDLVLTTDDGCEVLNSYPKDLRII